MLFAKEIIEWYQINKRELPWRNTRDPYLIWLSEVILQQTRVVQGLSYYHLFVETFPTVFDLASADEDTVLRMWQGLGYYSRARNLHKTAKIVVEDHEGLFPSDYAVLLTLPGVGEYTAAAVSSFSVDQVRAVLDGNVFRVLARYWGVRDAINTPKGKKAFSILANELIDHDHPSTYNQAIMEFGALQCKPNAPDCGTCPIKSACYAFNQQEVAQLPVKLKKSPSRNRYFSYFVIREGEYILINKRGKGDIWQHLHDFPMVETDKELEMEDLMSHSEVLKKFGGDLTFRYISEQYKHVLSHQNIYARFFEVSGSRIDMIENTMWNYVLIKDLDKLAKSKLIVSFLEKYFSNK